MTSCFHNTPPTLAGLLALNGKWHAAKPALIAQDGNKTWAQINAEANRIANGLHAFGLLPGDTVGYVMTNSGAALTVLLGILKAGCCSVPINLSVPAPAMITMLRDSGAKALFCSDDQTKALDEYRADLPVFCLTTLRGCADWISLSDFMTDNSPAEPQFYPDPDTRCNIIYSSGTTGLPKGIVHTFQGRMDWAYDMALALRYDSACKTLFTIGLYSNISWVGMLATLLMAGTFVIEESFDAERTLQIIEREGITNASMVPLQYQKLLEVPGQEKYDLSSLRAVMSCGSPLFEGLKSQMYDRLGPKIIELYGLTEGLMTTLSPEDANGRMASVGKPVMGTDLKIIRDDDTEAQVNEAGEIVGIARFVMPGYLNRPDATLDAVWTDADGKKWMRTGDIGQLDEEGFLYIVDRKKDMILSGGQNIYPQDIEAIMMDHDGISEVAVIGIPHPKWGETPLAVAVQKPGQTLDADDVKNWTNERVGKQQRLSGVVFTNSLPRNPNGKILKRDLRKEYGEVHG